MFWVTGYDFGTNWCGEGRFNFLESYLRKDERFHFYRHTFDVLM